jgi:hypothetical protein
MEPEKITELRGHHLCLFLQSKILGSEFLKTTYLDSSSQIRVIANYDAVCSHCKLKDNHCNDKLNEILIEEDKQCINGYGLKLNSVYPSDELLKTIWNHSNKT